MTARGVAPLSALGGFELHFEPWPNLRSAPLTFCAELGDLFLTVRTATRHVDSTENGCAWTRGARKTGGSVLAFRLALAPAAADVRVSRWNGEGSFAATLLQHTMSGLTIPLSSTDR